MSNKAKKAWQNKVRAISITKKIVADVILSAIATVFAVLLAAGVSILMRYVFTMISGGFAVIISAAAASALAAVIFPVKDDEEADE